MGRDSSDRQQFVPVKHLSILFMYVSLVRVSKLKCAIRGTAFIDSDSSDRQQFSVWICPCQISLQTCACLGIF